MSTSASYATVVQELYVANLGRPADPTGLQNFEAALAAANAPTTLSGLLAVYGTNAAVTALVDAFGNSAESGRLFGTNIASSTAAAQSFVTAVFESLFNRAPLAAGLAFWSNAITSGSVTSGEAALAIASGAGTADSLTVANKLAAAADFTADLASHGDVALTTYRGATAAAEGRAFLAQIDGTITEPTYSAFAAATANAIVNGAVPPATPTPATTPPPAPTPTLALTVSGDTIHLSGTTAASTVSLTGADLNTYPSGRFGTVAELVAAGVTSVTDSGGNFTLNASGNANATTFNFGTGVVSGADAASGVAITYSGVTTYVTSTHGDTVTLSGATQNVTASYSGNTINLGSLAYAGTLTLNTGPGPNSGGTDTINATVGGDLSHATIVGSNAAEIALVLSSGGTETLSSAEYNTITATSGGSITFTNGSFGSNQITFADTGTVTAIANVGNYNLSSVGNHITLTNAADNVTGDANGGTNVVNLGALAYTGTLNFGSGGTDTVNATVGNNIGGATITSSGATVALALSGPGTEILSTEEFNLVTSGAYAGGLTFSGGSFAGNKLTFSDAGSVAAIATVGTYNLSTGGNTIVLDDATDNVNGAASGNNTVDLGALAYTGTLAFGATGTDTVEAALNGDISGATITSGGAKVALVVSGPGGERLSTEEYNLLATGADAGGITFTGGAIGSDTITFSDAGTVTAIASVGNYYLAAAGNTITLTDATDNVADVGGKDTVNLGALNYTGTIAFASNFDSKTGPVTFNVSGNSDISGATFTGGAHIDTTLVLAAGGKETMSVAEYNLFNFGSIQGGTFGGDTIALVDGGTITANANVGNYDLSTTGNTITLTDPTDHVAGAASGNDTVNLAALAYIGKLAFGATGADTVNATVGVNIGGATITSGGATVALVLSGPGGEMLSTEEYNLLTTGADAGGITFTGGAFGSDSITFSDAGTVTAIADVGKYYLAAAGNTITLTDATDNVTGAPIGNYTVNLGALDYKGSILFDSKAGSNIIDVSGSSDISGATIASGGATVALVLDAGGKETLTTAEYNLFNVGGISGGTPGSNTIIFTNGGTVTANSDVGNYQLSASGNAITLTDPADNVTGASSGNDNVNLAALNYKGTVLFGAGGADTIDVSNGSNISAASINASGTTTIALAFNAAGAVTMTTEQYGVFNANGIGGGTFDGDTITFTDTGTVTANANVRNYGLSAAGNTITLTNVADDVTGAASGSDTVNLGALAYAGTLTFGTGGSDTVDVSGSSDISHSTITSSGSNVALVLAATGTETMSTEQFNLFSHISGGVASSNTVAFSDAGGVTANGNVNVNNYYLSADGNSVLVQGTTDNVTGAASGDDSVTILDSGYTGTLTFGTSGTDIVVVIPNINFGGVVVNSSGATLELSFNGETSGVSSYDATTTEIYNQFTTGPHAGGIVLPSNNNNPGDYTMRFTDQGTLIDSASIDGYALNAAATSTVNDIYTFTIANNAADKIAEYSAATGGSTYNINVATFTGSLTLGASGADTINIDVSNNVDISAGSINSGGTEADLVISGFGTLTVSSSEAATFHAATTAIVAPGTDTMNIADAASPINLSAQENALTTVGLLVAGNQVNVSVGADSVNASAAGFNQSITEHALTGSNTFNIDNGAATIAGAADATHYVTIYGFNTSSDNLVLTLSGVNQNGTSQSISDSGNDPITATNNGVIYLVNLANLTGYVVANANDLSSAETNILAAVDPTTASNGVYTFVIPTINGAAIYETHFSGSTLDGIQLVGVASGVAVYNMVGHIA